MFGRRKKRRKHIGVVLVLMVVCIFVCSLGSVRVYAMVKKISQNVEYALSTAKQYASQYDYQSAVEYLQEVQQELHLPQISKKIEYYIKKQNELQPADVEQIPHIFFHSLVVDTDRAFDGDSDADGYNQFMTTEKEFRGMLEQLYYNGYVLVSPYDAYVETEEGIVPGSILLPKGKRPLIISQDDVNYYSYMENDGFADRLVMENGKVRCEYTDADGNTLIGAYDLIPILDDFVDAHPDFSYRGAKAVIAVTGYEGVFGYDIDPESSDYEEKCEKVRCIAKALRSSGYVIASHTYGHIRCGTVPVRDLVGDTVQWEMQIGSLIGNTDILIFPYGEDLVSSCEPDAYETTERFEVLYDAGYRYFFNVDSSHPAWAQLNSRYFRGARRNLDGFRMYYYPEQMYDLFYDFDAVYDRSRPAVSPADLRKH